jgi:hypothetical protein
MNGCIVFGVCLIAVGLTFRGGHTVTLMVGGMLVALIGAFLPAKRPANTLPKRLPSADDPWV